MINKYEAIRLLNEAIQALTDVKHSEDNKFDMTVWLDTYLDCGYTMCICGSIAFNRGLMDQAPEWVADEFDEALGPLGSSIYTAYHKERRRYLKESPTEFHTLLSHKFVNSNAITEEDAIDYLERVKTIIEGL